MRIDKYLSESLGSRNKAARALKDGRVTVNGKRVLPSYEVKEDDKVDVAEAPENYVSVGGFKLSKSLKDFGYSPDGKIFADIGASTGGFTDCLLQNGAKKVYCIDVGESQLDERLKTRNVVIIDNFNARDLRRELFAESLDGAVIDVSFISLTYILKGVAEVLGAGKEVIALIKPQFECEKRSIGKNGVVRDPALKERAIRKVLNFAKECDLAPVALTGAPVVKGKNNEYLVLLVKSGVPKDVNLLIKSVKL